MGLFFRNDLFDQFGSWPLGYTATGGIDVGVIQAVGAAVGDGDASAYHAAWVAMGDRIAGEADAALAAGRPTAGALYLQASVCYATSYHPLYGAPVDPRLTATFRRQIEVFDKGLSLRPVPVAPLRIPYQGTSMPGYLIRAEGRETETRPLVILTNGYDATVTENYFAVAVAVARRGYHCLVFDGPGQGEMLIEQGIPIRPDWEVVIRAVVDFALTQPGVDADRVALSGWSLGGYLALRGAAGEPRLAACIADPGLRAAMSPEMLSGLTGKLVDAASAGSFAESALEALLKAKPEMRWALLQRGLWVHGVDSLGSYAEAAMQFTLEGRVGDIRCPVLLTLAEEDRLSQGAPALYEELTCPKTLLRFTAAEGAGDHCEMRNRTLAMGRMLDWLDDTLGA